MDQNRDKDLAQAYREKSTQLIDSTDAAVISTDERQTISQWNDAARQIFGYTRDEILGQPLGKLIPPHLRERHACHVRRFLQTGETERPMGERQEIRGQRKDGSTFPARASIFKTRLPDGEIELSVMLRDISEDKQLKELEESLRISREIQLHFFPKELPELAGVDLAAVNVPSRTVSGDYYDFIRIVKDHWGLVIGDVAGKGISAGLMMSAFRAALLAEIRNSYALTTVLSKVNELLFETAPVNRFVTAFYGVFDEKHRMLTYANAGHNPPVLFRRNGVIENLDAGGMILGAFPDQTYEEGHVHFESGDWLILYTDGLTEAHGPFRDQIGRERLIDFLRPLSKEPASVITQRLLEWVMPDQQEDPQDDVSLVVLKLV